MKKDFLTKKNIVKKSFPRFLSMLLAASLSIGSVPTTALAAENDEAEETEFNEEKEDIKSSKDEDKSSEDDKKEESEEKEESKEEESENKEAHDEDDDKPEDDNDKKESDSENNSDSSEDKEDKEDDKDSDEDSTSEKEVNEDDDETNESYKVKFIDYDGTILSEQDIKEGNYAKAPSAPKRDGYKFTGWDKDLTAITEDTTYTAQYEEVDAASTKFIVRFEDFDGKLIEEQQVVAGENAKEPTEPTRKGYKFIGWDCELENITEDIIVTAQYEELAKVIATFIDFDETVIAEIEVGEGEDVEAPEVPEREGYRFIGWDKELTAITEDTTFTAEYELDGSYPEIASDASLKFSIANYKASLENEKKYGATNSFFKLKSEGEGYELSRITLEDTEIPFEVENDKVTLDPEALCEIGPVKGTLKVFASSTEDSEDEIQCGKVDIEIIDYTYEKEFHFEQTVGSTRVIVEAPEGVLPDSAVANIKLVSFTSTKRAAESAIEKELNKDTDENVDIDVVGLNLYDIKIEVDGIEVQPRDEFGEVTVKFSDIKIKTEESSSDDVEFVRAFHIAENNADVEEMELDVNVSEAEVSFDTEHFSKYALAVVGGSARYEAGTNVIKLAAGEYTFDVYGAAGGDCFTYYDGDWAEHNTTGGHTSATFSFDESTTLTLTAGTKGTSANESDADAETELAAGYPGGGKGFLYGGAGGGYSEITKDGNVLVTSGGGAGGSAAENKNHAILSQTTGKYEFNNTHGGDKYGYFTNDKNGMDFNATAPGYVIGGAGGGYKGGKTHQYYTFGGASFVSEKALSSQIDIGGNNEDGYIIVSWNKCHHAEEDWKIVGNGDHATHKRICEACDETIVESLPCADEDENGKCDDCGQALPPKFNSSEVATNDTITYGDEDITYSLNPIYDSASYSLSYQWMRINLEDESTTPIEGAQSSTLSIGSELDAGTHNFICEVTYTGEESGTIHSAIKTINVEKAQPFLYVSENAVKKIFGFGKYNVAFNVTKDEANLIDLPFTHGGELIVTSSDEEVVTVKADKGNKGNIELAIGQAGTATITYYYTEGTNYLGMSGGTIEVTVDKAKITSFVINDQPEFLLYNGEEKYINFSYEGIGGEWADGTLEYEVETVSQSNGKNVLTVTPVENVNGKLKVKAINAGTAVVKIKLTAEGRNYYAPSLSDLGTSDVLTTTVIEVRKAQGSISFENAANITAKIDYTKDTKNTTDITLNFSTSEIANDDYEIGNITKELTGDAATVTDPANGSVTVTPVKSGNAHLTLNISETENYEAASVEKDITIKTFYHEDGVNYEFEQDDVAHTVTILDVKADIGSTLPESLELPNKFILDGTTYTVKGINDNAIAASTGIKNVTVPKTLTTFGTNAIDSTIRITAYTGSPVIEFSKVNGNPTTVIGEDFTYELKKENNTWVAANFNPNNHNGVIRIPSNPDGLDIYSYNVDMSTVDKIITDNNDISYIDPIIKDGVIVETPDYIFTMNNDKITNLDVKNATGKVNVPLSLGNHDVISINRDLADKADELVFNCNHDELDTDSFFFSDGNGFTSNEDGLRITFNDISYVIGEKDNTIVAKDVIVTPVAGVATIPTTVNGLTVESVSENISNETTKVIMPSNDMTVPEQWFNDNTGLEIVKPDYSYTIGTNGYVENYKPSTTTGVITIPATVDGHPVRTMADGVIKADTDKVIIESDIVFPSEKDLTDAKEGLIVETPTYNFEVGANGTIINVNNKSTESTITFPGSISGHDVANIDRDSIKDNTTTIVINKNYSDFDENGIFADGNGFTENEVDKKFIFNDISFTIGKDKDGNIVIKDFDVTDKTGTIVVPGTIGGIPVVDVNDNITDDTTEKIILPEGVKTPESAFDNPGTKVEKDGIPSTEFTTGENGTIEDWKQVPPQDKVVIPTEEDGHEITDISPDAIGPNTEEIEIQNPNFDLEPEDFENIRPEGIKVTKEPLSYIIKKDENGNIIITDYNTSDKEGIIYVPTDINGIPVASISKDIANDTTAAVVVTGKDTVLPSDAEWKDTPVLVIIGSKTEEEAKKDNYEKILYIALGGIEVSYEGAKAAGSNLDKDKVVITGYWNVDRTASGTIAWEDMTLVPTELKLKKGTNSFTFGYYGENATLTVKAESSISGNSGDGKHDHDDNNNDDSNNTVPTTPEETPVVTPEVPSQDKNDDSKDNNDKELVDVPTKPVRPVVDVIDDDNDDNDDEWNKHFSDIVDEIGKEDLDKLIDKKDIHADHDAVDSLYENGFDELTDDLKEALLNSDLANMSIDEIKALIASMKDSNEVSISDNEQMLTNENEENTYDHNSVVETWKHMTTAEKAKVSITCITAGILAGILTGNLLAAFLFPLLVAARRKKYTINGKLPEGCKVAIDVTLNAKDIKMNADGTFSFTNLNATVYTLKVTNAQNKALGTIRVSLANNNSTASIIINNGLSITTTSNKNSININIK